MLLKNKMRKFTWGYVTPVRLTETHSSTSPSIDKQHALRGALKGRALFQKRYHSNWQAPIGLITEKRILKRKRARLRATVAKEVADIQEIARRHSAVAMQRIAEIAQNSENETAAIAAANLLLDRAYGKASQTNINATIDANGKTTDVSGKELASRIEKALNRVRELTGGVPKPAPRKERPANVRKLDRSTDGSSLH